MSDKYTGKLNFHLNNLADPLSDREKLILSQLVGLYLRDGAPIGSKTLVSAENQQLAKLSSATVRKVLGDLAELGYLKAMHASSGKIPTARGLRFFVDNLLQTHNLDLLEHNALQKLTTELHGPHNQDSLIQSAAGLLADLTNMVGVIALPQVKKLILKHVEFMQLSENRILVILIVNEHHVENRIITPQKKYTKSELNQASNFLNQHFVGKDLKTIRQDILVQMQSAKSQLDNLMQTVIDVADQSFAQHNGTEQYVLTGQENLLKGDIVPDLSNLKSLFTAFSEKQQILDLLNHSLAADGVQMYIGEESGFHAFESFSVITCRYTLEGENIGALGVIGPSRMPYAKIIPVVEVTAKLLSSVF